MTRAAAIVGLSLLAACAHTNSPVTVPVVDESAAALRLCIEDSETCPALAKRLETKLLERYDAPSAHRLAWQMTETIGRGDLSVVGTRITRCRAGHAASCRALFWAIDRLYLAEDASVARANECGLTDAVASALAAK